MGEVYRKDRREDMRIVAIAEQNELPLVDKYIAYYDRIVITGVGGTNVIKALQSYPRTSHIINIGYAGSGTIPKGSAVRVKDVSLFHKVCDYDEPIMHLEDEGVHCYTSCDFVGDKERENSVFDMELAFIAAMGFRKVESIKVISDGIDYAEYCQTINR